MTDRTNSVANMTPDPNATPDANAPSSTGPGPASGTKEMAKADKKKGKDMKATPTKTEEPKPEGKKVRKRITAPSRLEKLQEQWRSGKLPKGISVSNSGGKFKAFESTYEK